MIPAPTPYLLRMSMAVRAWIAIVAMLALALLPTLTQAMVGAAASQGTIGAAGLPADFCMPGANSADSGQDGFELGGPIHAAAHLQHCASCLIAVDVLGPPPHPPLGLALADAPSQPLPSGDTACPRGRTVWQHAQPRAPPTDF